MLLFRVMRIPVIPLVVAVILFGTAFFFLTMTGPVHRSLDAPKVSPIIDVTGIETDLAIAPDGVRYAVISSGNLWFVNDIDGAQRQITDTPEPESAPDWTPDGERITFSRGGDTYEVRPEDGRTSMFLSDATELSWSSDERIVFVRNRALWVAAPDGKESQEVVTADPNEDITLRSPRFSPDGTELVFIKSMLNLRGEVWRVDLGTIEATPVIADRNAENPTAVEWVLDNRHLVYLTDRAGGLAVWYIDLNENTLLPMTSPMMGLALEPLGIAVSGERVVLPRHFFDSDIATSEGTPIIDTDHLEFEPSVSPDGQSIVYCVANEGRFELWLASIHGQNRQYLALGRQPRFSPNGNEIVYTRTDLDGNKDIWKVDIRTGVPERLTDAAEIDTAADWSPDGRSIVFASERGGALALWTIPSSGGKRLKLNGGGYGPRYSPDGTAILYWHKGSLWTAAMDGSEPQEIAVAPDPISGVWSRAEPAFLAGGTIRTSEGDTGGLPGLILPWFDDHPEGTWLVSSVEIEKTELWALDLMFKEN